MKNYCARCGKENTDASIEQICKVYKFYKIILENKTKI